MIQVNSKCKFHLLSANGSELRLQTGEQLPHESAGPRAPWSALNGDEALTEAADSHGLCAHRGQSGVHLCGQGVRLSEGTMGWEVRPIPGEAPTGPD